MAEDDLKYPQSLFQKVVYAVWAHTEPARETHYSLRLRIYTKFPNQKYIVCWVGRGRSSRVIRQAGKDSESEGSTYAKNKQEML